MSQRDANAKLVELVDNVSKSRPFCLLVVLPIRTYSEANGLLSQTRFYKNGKPKPEHWTEKNARHKAQKAAVIYALRPRIHEAKLPCTVTLTRYAPKMLDWHDNLPISFKWITDAVCDMLIPGEKAGIADSDERIKIKYDQEKCSEYKIKIEITW